MNKFRNIRTTIDGITFASKHEAMRYSKLKLLEKAKAITDLRLQVKYMLTPAQNGEYRKEQAMNYIADFVYLDLKRGIVVEDVKGFRTEVYKLKKKLFQYKFYPLEITES